MHLYCCCSCCWRIAVADAPSNIVLSRETAIVTVKPQACYACIAKSVIDFDAHSTEGNNVHTARGGSATA